MKQSQGVLWTKGLLLTPQHLQTQDRHLEGALSFRLAAHSFYPWGFRDLSVDRQALAGGNLALSKATGIFQDGLLFDIPASDPPPDPKPLDERWDDERESLLAYLVIPEYRLGAQNVSGKDEERSTRYWAEVVTRRDENTGRSEKPIQLARKNFRLAVEGESLEGTTTLPVARVRRDAAGEYELDPHFVPPAVDISASDRLLSITRRLVEILSSKSANLSGMRRQRSRSLADFGVSDVANFWLLYTVNTHLPELRHFHERRRGHPVDLFRSIATLAGALTTFSDDYLPKDLPEYDHRNLPECFGRLDEMARELLETVIPSRHVSLPLERTEPSIYAAALAEDRFFQARQIFLAVRTAAEDEEILRRAPDLLKVSSVDRVEELIRQALPGVGLRHVERPPSALPVKLDFRYFELERTGDDWDAIRRARNIAAYVPSELPEPTLELVILDPPEEA